MVEDDRPEGNLHTLGDGVGCDKCQPCIRGFLDILCPEHEPAGDVILEASVFYYSKNSFPIGALNLIQIESARIWRISAYIYGTFTSRTHIVPIQPQGITTYDMACLCEGKCRIRVVVLLVALHVDLMLGKPEGEACDLAGEIVYLDAVEVVEMDADKRKLIYYGYRPHVEMAELLISGDQEVSAAASRIEHLDCGNFIPEPLEFLLPSFSIWQIRKIGKLRPQAIEK